MPAPYVLSSIPSLPSFQLLSFVKLATNGMKIDEYKVEKNLLTHS
jgi:hypothetical protein